MAKGLGGACKENGAGNPQAVSTQPIGLPLDGRGRLVSTEMVREVLKDMPEAFTKNDVAAAILKTHPDVDTNGVTGVLLRLKKLREVREISAGAGRKPSVFSATKHQLALGEVFDLDTAEIDMAEVDI